MKLSPMFSDGMVLQREVAHVLWGTSGEKTRVMGRFAECSFETECDEKGRFEVVLPSAESGGPYELVVWEYGKEGIVIRNILVGDVFLLGGQSNMELPLRRTLDLFREELEYGGDAWIRLFEVQKECVFGEQREDLQGGKWIIAAGGELLDFCAAGYFMAKECRDRTGVPVGLIQTAVGGTQIKAWCSEASLLSAGLYGEELSRHFEWEEMEDTRKQEEAAVQEWFRMAGEGFLCPEGVWQSLSVPGLWEDTVLGNFCGSLMLEKKFWLSKAQCGKKADIVLGALVDADQVYINKKLVGETGYKYPPRRYEIPGEVLLEGENTISIHMYVFRGKGGFVPDKEYAVEFNYSREGAVKLGGEWDFRIGKRMPPLREQTIFKYLASGLYNGMIYPVRRWNICAFLYYQGESDTALPQGYADKMSLMIGDWRKLWSREELPFIFVQLAGFSDSKKPCHGKNWARLREEQRNVLNMVPGTAMVVSLDAGEYNDLHPQDKKTVGHRMALAIRKMVYGEELVFSGPLYHHGERKGDSLFLYFEHTGSGLIDKMETGLCGFEICSKDGEYAPVRAEIWKDRVRILAEGMKAPFKVRYAWSDYPEQAYLYNKEGLPASPFSTEYFECN